MKYLHGFKKKAGQRRGFTLAETLIVVGILLILMALIVPNLVKTQKELRQKELDAKAEIVYVAAQNRLTKLRASGNSNKYSANLRALQGDPDDLAFNIDDRQLYYFTSEDLEIMSEDVIDGVTLPGSFVVEFVYDEETRSASVYSVFYSEKLDVASGYPGASGWATYNPLRNRETRLEQGAKVGYYGGDVSSTTNVASELMLTISPSNGETLSVYLECRVPASVKNPSSLQMDFILTIEDAVTGKSVQQRLSTLNEYFYPNVNLKDGTGSKIQNRGRLFFVNVTMDDLSKAELRFNELFGNGASPIGGGGITPGHNLKLMLSVIPKDGSLAPADKVYDGTVNSLFANGSTTENAKISCGRHLQNLNASGDDGSGVTDVTSAELTGKIDFLNTKSSGWHETYKNSYFNGCDDAGEPYFAPITNSRLNSFTGAGNMILGLNAAKPSKNVNAGLFGTFSGEKLEKVTLVGPKASGSGSVGALAGEVTGSCTLSECGVYLDHQNSIRQIKTNWIDMIDGAQAGGLVGAVRSGSLSVEKSFAATTVKGTAAAGGLVGSVASGSLSIEKSYADCYINYYSAGESATTGGLVGSGSVSSVKDSYAAGFMAHEDGDVSAGLVNGSVGTLENSYTVCALGKATTTYAVASSGSAEHVYYLSGGNTEGTTGIEPISSDKATLCESLGSAFIVDVNADDHNTSPDIYNLKTNLNTNYPYPFLKIQPVKTSEGATLYYHHGDWQADFEPGSLIYYELYADGTKAAALANMEMPKNKIVVGDGYGIVFEKDKYVTGTTITFTPETGDPETIKVNSVTPIEVKDDEGRTYHVFPLKKETVNPDLSSVVEDPATGLLPFWQRATVSVQMGGKTTVKYYATNFYFANCLMELQQATAAKPDVPETIYVRSPRHLNALSVYYDDAWWPSIYNAVKEKGIVVTFWQELELDYSTQGYNHYHWDEYTRSAVSIHEQEPIGRTRETSFCASYDGFSNKIRNLSIRTVNGLYVGLFGYNEAWIQNVVLYADYVAGGTGNAYILRTGSINANKTVNMGALVGCNIGTLYNCAAAGYDLSGTNGGLIHTYENGTLYLGGLVGVNGNSFSGTIEQCSVDSPYIGVSSYASNISIGGLTGRNEGGGNILNSYAIGYLDLYDVKGYGVDVSGFAGTNYGQIRSSYCAVSIFAQGTAARTHAFSPASGGQVLDCYYLNEGTYTYAEKLHSYTFEKRDSSGTSATYAQLEKRASGAHVTAANSEYYHQNYADQRNYPFRGLVLKGTTRVHYGEWPIAPHLGTLGIFYWEHEEGGSNNGYHLTFLGMEDGNIRSGTTLCTAHDDGGAITEYGYGYYVLKTEDAHVRLESANGTLAILDGENNVVTDLAAMKALIDTTARDELQLQMQGVYYFYPWVTGSTLTLRQPAGAAAATLVREGDWTLHFGQARAYNFKVAPFFANAMQFQNTGKEITVTSTDGIVSRYDLAPGHENNNYEIRSAEQLRYLNWNYETQDCDTLVYKNGNKDNRDRYPYLMYSNTNAVQTLTGDGTRPGRVEVHDLHWRQSHDVDGSKIDNFTPIAGSRIGTSSTDTTAKAMLYTWFGSYYDGQSYKLQNFDINSGSFTVGIFGVTVGANIENAIMFSEKKADGTYYQIIRDTEQGGTAGETGAYYIGGLIGLAYDYDTTSTNASNNKVNTIKNCAIAGYELIDRSTNQQGRGHGNVGGLVGMANVNLENCSAVTHISIECTHENGHMIYGDYVHAGGLAGSTKYQVKNCYTGGSIDVLYGTLMEFHEKTGALTNTPEGELYRANNLSIYVGGVSAGVYSCVFTNFKNAKEDGTPVFTNCYSYTQLPALRGTIKGVSLIGTVADRYGKNESGITFNNCYYVGTGDWRTDYPYDMAYVESERPYVFVNSSGGSAPISRPEGSLIQEFEWEQILRGRTTVNKYIISGDNGKPKFNGKNGDDALCPLNYASFEDFEYGGGVSLLSDTAWHIVTMGEGAGYNEATGVGGNPINGKYSFSSDPRQDGKNYPYPAVIKQKDLVNSTKDNPVYVYVHYGEWPADASYWAKGRDSMDIFADMGLPDNPSAGETGTYFAEKTFTLHSDVSMELTPDSFNANPDAYSESGMVTCIAAVSEDGGYTWNVTFRALKSGSVVITQPDCNASFTLNITAKLKLSSDPAELKVYYNNDEPQSIWLIAEAAEESSSHTYNNFSKLGVWELKGYDTASQSLIECDCLNPDGTGQNIKNRDHWGVKSIANGKLMLAATFTYIYNGISYDETLVIPMVTLGRIGLLNTTTGQGQDVQRLPESSTTIAGDPVTAFYGELPKGPELVLYAPAVDADLNKFDILEIKVGDEAVWTKDGGDQSANYQVTFEKDPVETGDYSYRVAYVRRLDPTLTGTVNVSVRLKEPNGDCEYLLTAKDVQTHLYDVEFDKNGGTGTMLKHGHNGGDFTVPACGFTRTGYTFKCWTLEGAQWYYPTTGDLTIDLAGKGDVTFVAQWNANKYHVRFDANGGSGTMAPQEFTYDVKQNLTPNAFTGPTENGTQLVFSGWNTDKEGNGMSYANNEEVLNLTTDAEITLYAQWSDRHYLTLRFGSEEWTYDINDVNDHVSVDYEDANALVKGDHWELLGWYTGKTADAVRVLDKNGRVTQEAYTYYPFTSGGALYLYDSRTLYARWVRTTAGGDPTGTLFVSETGALTAPGEYVLVKTEVSGSVAAVPEKYPSLAVKVMDLDLGDASKGTVIADTLPDKARWTAVDGTGGATLQNKENAETTLSGVPTGYTAYRLQAAVTSHDPATDASRYYVEYYHPDALTQIKYLDRYNDEGLTHEVIGAFDGIPVTSWKLVQAPADITVTAGTELTMNQNYKLYSDGNRLTLRFGNESNDAWLYEIDNVNGLDSVNYLNANALVKDHWVLLGWYTGKTAEAVKILDQDGHVSSDAATYANYTSDGKLALNGSLTLYARWARATAAGQPTGTLFVSQTGDLTASGEYVLVKTENSGSVANVPAKYPLLSVKVMELEVGDASQGKVIADSLPDKARWTAVSGTSGVILQNKDDPGTTLSGVPDGYTAYRLETGVTSHDPATDAARYYVEYYNPDASSQVKYLDRYEDEGGMHTVLGDFNGTPIIKWKLVSDSSQPDKYPGDKLTMDQNYKLEAKKMFLTVHFVKADGDPSNMPDITVAYSETLTIPAPAANFPFSDHLHNPYFRWSVSGATDVYRNVGETVSASDLGQGSEEVTLMENWTDTSTLTLMIGKENPEVYTTATVSAAGAVTWADGTYTAPVKTDWTLDSWCYVQGESSSMVLYGDGNPKNLSAVPYAQATLYARWSGTGYVQVDELSGGAAANGTYLIANANSGDIKLMGNSETGNDTANFKTEEVNLSTVFMDSSDTLGQVILLDFTDSAPYKWTVEYRSEAQIENPSTSPDRGKFGYKDENGATVPYDRYMIFNMNGLSLRDNGNDLKMRNASGSIWGNQINNRNLWTYGIAREHAEGVQPMYNDTVREHQLISECADYNSQKWAAPANQKVLGYNSGWKVGTNYSCFLYKEQTVYTYDP